MAFAVLKLLMHFLTLRQRSSKIYSDKVYNIPMDNDRSHINMNHNKVEETRVVQERRQIDKIMHGIIKERLFSNFIEEETRISDESYTKISGICKKGFFGGRFRGRGRDTLRASKTIEVAHPKAPRKTVNFSNTIQCFSSSKEAYSVEPIAERPKRFFQSQSRPRRDSLRLPDLQRSDTAKTAKIRPSLAMAVHPKKFEFIEKAFSQTFRRWSGCGSQVLTNEIRISKEVVIGRLRGSIEGGILERFFHFFNFPQQFSLRQYAALLENAANCSLRFIYFWVFTVLDDNSNGVLTMQELFKFLQRFPDNGYVEEELFLLAQHVGAGREEREAPVEEGLAVNRNLKMEELNVILKKSTKERIDVGCVKSTCYHLSVLSLEHDTLERAKLDQIEDNEEMAKLMKLRRKDEKQKLDSLPGIRLRDLQAVFEGRRPKIFCFVLHLLAGVPPRDYE